MMQLCCVLILLMQVQLIADVATQPASRSIEDWRLTLFLRDFRVKAADSSALVFEMVNKTDDSSEVYPWVGYLVFGTGEDGKRLPLWTNPTPASSGRGVDPLLAMVEIDLPSIQDPPDDAGAIFATDSGKIVHVKILPHGLHLMKAHLPSWFFKQGPCRLRVVLYRGETPVAFSESRTIEVDPAGE